MLAKKVEVRERAATEARDVKVIVVVGETREVGEETAKRLKRERKVSKYSREEENN